MNFCLHNFLREVIYTNSFPALERFRVLLDLVLHSNVHLFGWVKQVCAY